MHLVVCAIRSTQCRVAAVMEYWGAKLAVVCTLQQGSQLFNVYLCWYRDVCIFSLHVGVCIVLYYK